MASIKKTRKEKNYNAFELRFPKNGMFAGLEKKVEEQQKIERRGSKHSMLLILIERGLENDNY